ncbi:MAG: hypothetical protein HYY16_11050 [Planctomycetes bacterium]|nr:hypothetical protein [Planctomycetota bacterium]
MSDPRRTGFKIALLLAPALVLSLTLRFWGDALGMWSRNVLSRPRHVAKLNDHQLELPAQEWEQPTLKFFEEYLSRFALDHPFQNRRNAARAVAHPLKPLTRPLIVIFTSDAQSFPKEEGGHFDAAKAVIVMDARDGTPESVRRSFAHQLTHAIMRFSYADDPQWTPWFREGVAQWCETDTWEHPLGVKQLGWLREIRHGVKPGNLLALLKADPERFHGTESSWYYRAAYALVAFLLEEGDLRKGFLSYFDSEAAPGPHDTVGVFETRVGAIEDVEHRWIEWLLEQRT